MRSSQQRAVANHRRRLAERGIGRYEVRGLEKDKELVRSFARRLAAGDAAAARLRASVEKEIGEAAPSGKQIWAALRASPLVGTELNLQREIVSPRDVDL